MNNDNIPRFSYKALSIAVGFAMLGQSQIALANDEPETTLDTIVIEASSSDSDIPTISAKPLTDKTTAKTITEQLIMDNRDLVRYNPEVTIGEVGRYGSKGFNIQGMEGNRVAMLIDGVRVPEIETNEFFSPYGYMNESRFMADVETLQSVTINKGADSLNSGSGAVGGAVMFKSREPDDLIKNGQSVGGYVKGGYTSKNQEWLKAFGVAGRSEKWRALINYAHREGHELKNHDMRKFDRARLNFNYEFPKEEFGNYNIKTSYLYPDPAHYTQDSTLVKLYYTPTEQHKFGVQGSYQYLINQNVPVSKTTVYPRFGFDENERTAYSFNYEYMPNASRWLDNLKFDYTNQHIVTVGDTYNREINSSEWAGREYRPNYFYTKQYSLEGSTINLMPPDSKAWLGEHTIKFGVQYSKQDYDPYMIACNQFECPAEDARAVMLPTITDIYSTSFKDNVYLNDKVKFNFGLRYDNYKRGVTSLHNHPGLQSILIANGKKYDELDALQKAHRDGILYDKYSKDAWTWQTAFSYKPKDDIQLDYQIGTGFLVPQSNQMYAGFRMLGGQQIANLTLQPEKSLNQQISVQKSWDNGFAKLTGYYNRYTNFIDTEEYNATSRNIQTPYGTCFGGFSCYVYVNKDRATSKGIALTGNYRLPYQTYGNFDVRGQLAYQTGKASDGTNLLAIQPLNGLVGLRYQPHSDRFEINAIARYFGKKHAKDTYRKIGDNIEILQVGRDARLTADNFSKNAWIFDLYGNVKLVKGLSLQAGVYNLTNEKYIPWDNLRTLATTGINSMVDPQAKGLNRYTASGRNFAVSLNYAF